MNAAKIGLVSAILIAAPAFAAEQDETLQYVGSPFTSFTATGNIANAFAASPAQNSGEIVLGAPLGDNLNDVAVSPLSWNFDATTNSNFYLVDLPSNSMTFTVSTNAHGDLTAWNLSAGGNDFGSTNTPSYAAITLTNGGDSFAAGVSGYACAPPPGGLTSCFDVSESNSVAGSWTTETKSVPEFDTTFLYTALTLLLGSLAVLRGRRPRRSTTTES
jgi:hypothetical protein